MIASTLYKSAMKKQLLNTKNGNRKNVFKIDIHLRFFNAGTFLPWLQGLTQKNQLTDVSLVI